MKIRLVGTELFQVGRRTDRHYESNSCFSQSVQTRLKPVVKKLDEAKSVCTFLCSFNHTHLKIVPIVVRYFHLENRILTKIPLFFIPIGENFRSNYLLTRRKLWRKCSVIP